MHNNKNLNTIQYNTCVNNDFKRCVLFKPLKKGTAIYCAAYITIVCCDVFEQSPSIYVLSAPLVIPSYKGTFIWRKV